MEVDISQWYFKSEKETDVPSLGELHNRKGLNGSCCLLNVVFSLHYQDVKENVFHS